MPPECITICYRTRRIYSAYYKGGYLAFTEAHSERTVEFVIYTLMRALGWPGHKRRECGQTIIFERQP